MFLQRISFALFVLLIAYSCTKPSKATVVSTVTNSNVLKIDSLVSEANNLKNDYNYDDALQTYTNAFRIAKSIGDHNFQFHIEIKIAELFRSKGQFMDSEEHFEKAERYLIHAEEISLKNKLLYYNRKAAIWNEFHGNADTTIFYSNKALLIARKLKDNYSIFLSTMEIGVALESVNKFDSALVNFNDALLLVKNHPNIQLRCDALTNICRVELKKNNLSLAFQIATEGYQIAKKNKFLFSQLVFADFLRKIHKKRGDITLAYQYSEEVSRLKDLYFNKRYDEKSLETSKRLKISERENELRISREIIEQETLKKRTFQIILIFAIGLIFLTFYSLIKIRNQNKKLHYYNQENAFLLAETHHRVNNNLQLISIFIHDQIQKSDAEDKEGLIKVSNQVETLSLLHRHFYQADNNRMIDLRDYLLSIVDSYSGIKSKNEIIFDTEIETISLSFEKGIYLGLLINELITNSIKHAFKSQNDCRINLKVKQNDDVIVIHYFDNGICPSKNMKPGMIDKICRQLKTPYEVDYHPNFDFNTKIKK